MVRMLALVALASLTASQAWAEEISIKPKIIFSQVRTDAESGSIAGDTVTFKRTRDSNDSISGLGYGLDFEFKLDERMRVGSDVSYTNYDDDGTKASDLGLGGFLAFSFIDQDNLNVYGKGGLSLHQFAFEDFDSASLLNADIGLGVSFALASNLDFGGEYKYTTTLSKGDMSSSGSQDITIKDFSLERSDLSAFVAFKF